MLQAELFQPGQRVRFTCTGIYGADVPGREVYDVELLPPFQRGFCLRPQWHLSCPTYDGRRPPDESDQPPSGPLKYPAYLDVEKLKTAEEVKLLKYFVPYGLKPGGFVYSLSCTDSSASYAFYFKDWDTLVSHSAYNTEEDGRVVLVDQVLKRVKNPRETLRPSPTGKGPSSCFCAMTGCLHRSAAARRRAAAAANLSSHAAPSS